MRRGLALIVCGAALALAGRAPAEEPRRPATRAEFLQRAFADVVERNRGAVAEVQVGGNVVGYGCFVSEAGQLLTPSAPLADGGRITVTLSARHPYPARLVARDERWNLACVQVEPDELYDVLPLARGAEGERGAFAVSVGPGPVAVATGVVSATHRAIVALETSPLERTMNPAAALVRDGRRYAEVLQHDSLLTGTTIGAPLFDAGGRLLGLTVEVRTRGTAYAIPVARLQEALPALLAGRSTAARPSGVIGVQVAPSGLEPDRAKDLGIPGGVPIEALAPGPDGKPGGAQKAGLRPGDVIVAIGGRPVIDFSTLQELIQGREVGDVLPIAVLRGRERLEFQVEVGARPGATDGR